MRVGIDVRPALRRTTGVGRYARGLAVALAATGTDVLAFSASWKDRADPAAFAGCRMVDRRIPVRLLDAFWERLGAPSFERLAGPIDVVHSPTPLGIPSRVAARVVTVHDLYFLRHPEAVAGGARHWAERVAGAVRAADGVVCVSAATADDAGRLLGVERSRLHVVHSGLEPQWLEPLADGEADATLARLGVQRPFLLAVGAAEPRKNLPRLVEAFARVRAAGHEQLALVLAGPDGLAGPALRQAIEDQRVLQNVRRLDHQPDRTLRALYARAELLAMPSLDEGFGFPPLEAMASGCPVVAARAGALPEVAGDAALLVDPADVGSIAAGLREVLEDPARAADLRARGAERARRYTWEATARATLAVYRQAIATRSGR